MLYECVAGSPPFHGATEAETLWAHMQHPVPPVPGRPALDPVLRKALAKDPGERYGTCAELNSPQEEAGSAPSRVPPSAVELNATGERFVRGFGEEAHAGYVFQAAQATELVLAAIARSDGTRASVLRELRATHVRDGLIGDFRFDRYGDVTPARLTVLRMTADVPPGKRVPRLEDAVVDRVIAVPTEQPPRAVSPWRPRWRFSSRADRRRDGARSAGHRRGRPG